MNIQDHINILLGNERDNNYAISAEYILKKSGFSPEFAQERARLVITSKCVEQNHHTYHPVSICRMNQGIVDDIISRLIEARLFEAAKTDLSRYKKVLSILLPEYFNV
mgnify:CR=1 FL=1